MRLSALVTFALLLTQETYAFRLKPDAPTQVTLSKNAQYIVDIQSLFLVSDTDKLENGQLLPWLPYSDMERLYLWTTPLNLSKDEAVFTPSETQPYPIYSTYQQNNIFDSPLTPLLSPLRKGLYDLANYGFSTKIIALYFEQYTQKNRPNTSNNAGFIGMEAYSNWTITNNDVGISSLTFELGWQNNIYNSDDLSKSVGSIITSNVILGDSGAIIGDIYYSQGFFSNKVLVHAGRLTPWYYYGYNRFTDSEIDAFTSEMFSGSVALPKGGGNGSKPGISLQYFINEHFYFTSVLTNTEGEDSDFDFNIFNEDAYFFGNELGYISKRHDLNFRLSIGLHTAKVKQANNDERKTGYGFNLMYEQELTPNGYTPYIGTFMQIEYSDKEIAPATQQYSGGINIKHPFHRRGDALSTGFGTIKPSNENLNNEYFSETYYRLQFTQNLQWSFDLQLFINPSYAPQTTIAPVFNTRMLFSF